MDGNRTNADAGGEDRPRSFGLANSNLALLAVGAVVVLFGYILLSGGSVTAAPVLLVIGYVVLVPAGLLLGFRDRRRAAEGEDGGE